MAKSSDMSATEKPPPPPFKEAPAIKAAIDADTSGEPNVVPNAIKGLTEPNRSQFLEWYLQMADIQFDAEDQKDASSKPTTVSTFRIALETTDWSNRSSMDRLFTGALGSGFRAACEPIFMGKDNGFRYYLSSKRPVLALQKDVSGNESKGSLHPYALEIRNYDGSQPPFQYAFPLGTLEYYYDDPDNPKQSTLRSTPFRWYLDIVKKDIWLVLDRSFQDELGEEIAIPVQARTWSYLPSPQNDRNNFKAVLFTPLRDLANADENQGFFAPLDRSEVSEIDVLVSVASDAAVKAALQTHNRASGS